MPTTRRKFIASTPALSALGAGSASASVQEETTKTGTTDWQLTRVKINEGKYRTSLIEGYASRQSVYPGEEISFFVSTKPASDFVMDLYRMGFYDGKGGLHMKRLGPFSGRTQPTPERGKRRIRECRWKETAAFEVPDDWPSGVYLGKLTTIPERESDPYWQSYLIFVVKSSSPTEVVFQVSDNTWQAYNRWPENDSLYTNPDGAQAPGVAVSFDRPYGKYVQITDNPLSI